MLDKRAYAGGPMAEAVAHSTRYLSDDDLSAMAAYLKVIPILKTDDYVIPIDTSRLPNPVSSSITYNLIEQKDYLAQAKTSTNAHFNNDQNSPKALYLAACGSCHGVDGYAQPDARYASIVGLSSIRRVKPDALINVIAYGAKGALNTAPKMPGFSKELSHAQIASITNYVRVTFGGLQSSDVSAADVKRILK